MLDTNSERMTPDEFKHETTRRGWTYRALAERWGVSENYVSRLAGNVERRLWFDDAVRGLPHLVVKQVSSLRKHKAGAPGKVKLKPAASEKESQPEKSTERSTRKPGKSGAGSK